MDMVWIALFYIIFCSIALCGFIVNYYHKDKGKFWFVILLKLLLIVILFTSFDIIISNEKTVDIIDNIILFSVLIADLILSPIENKRRRKILKEKKKKRCFFVKTDYTRGYEDSINEG